jgi:hypothetical protein
VGVAGAFFRKVSGVRTAYRNKRVPHPENRIGCGESFFMPPGPNGKSDDVGFEPSNLFKKRRETGTVNKMDPRFPAQLIGNSYQVKKAERLYRFFMANQNQSFPHD